MRDDGTNSGSPVYVTDQSVSPVFPFSVTTGAQYTQINMDPNNFIKINTWAYGISVQVQGTGTFFAGSEGMFGSWDHGFVRFRNGTIFDTSGGFAATAATSIDLALDWMVPVSDSILFNPSNQCDASSSCGTGNPFSCTDVRRNLEIFESDSKNRKLATSCGKTCADITEPMTQLMCMEDMILSGGDEEWACDLAKLDPIVLTPGPNDFTPHPNDESDSQSGGGE